MNKPQTCMMMSLDQFLTFTYYKEYRTGRVSKKYLQQKINAHFVIELLLSFRASYVWFAIETNWKVFF